MKIPHVNADVPITVTPPARERTPPAGKTTAKTKKITRIVREALLLKTSEPYRKVQVEVEVDSQGNPNALLVSLLRAYTYTADIIRVEVDADLNVKEIRKLS